MAAARRSEGPVAAGLEMAPLSLVPETSLYDFDAAYRTAYGGRLAGVDEAGRGPLAGPVVAAAVILAPEDCFEWLDDSKRVTPRRRDRLFEKITARAIAWGIGVGSVAEIEEINILQATRRAMARAVAALGEAPEVVLVDAVTIPMSPPQVALVKGDQQSASIAAASILAKVTRDRLMAEYAVRYPGYGFDRHMGYPTAHHRQAVARLGPSPIHRKTFRGVREFVVAAD